MARRRFGAFPPYTLIFQLGKPKDGPLADKLALSEK